VGGGGGWRESHRSSDLGGIHSRHSLQRKAGQGCMSVDGQRANLRRFELVTMVHGHSEVFQADHFLEGGKRVDVQGVRQAEVQQHQSGLPGSPGRIAHPASMTCKM